MNIKNRLKKLEKAVIGDEGICVCHPAFHSEIYLQDLSEDATASEPKRARRSCAGHLLEMPQADS